MFIDSHCHLNCLEDFTSGALDDYLKRAKEHDVHYFLCVGIDLKDRDVMNKIAENYPEVWTSIGLHPNEPIDTEPTLEQLVAWSHHSKVIAIGETGLDYFRSEGDLDWQRERFRTHICAAKKVDLPIIVHSREAKEDTMTILKEENAADVGGVLHCFTGDLDMAMQAIDLGFYISFSGIITFKNAVDLQEVAKQLPLDKILIETDAPYLAPVPHRGKSNEPAYVAYVAKALADLKGISVDEVARVTSDNFFRLFQKAKA